MKTPNLFPTLTFLKKTHFYCLMLLTVKSIDCENAYPLALNETLCVLRKHIFFRMLEVN